MFRLFYAMKSGKKGQVVSVLTVALIIFIIAAFVAVNFGKSKLQGVRVVNAAQASVLAGGSVGAVMLNNLCHLNDAMILNIAGFTAMIQLMIVSWLYDFVMLTIEVIKTFSDCNNHNLWGTKVVPAFICLLLTTAAITLQIIGTEKAANALYKYIEELNAPEKLSKNTRDSARSFAFMNAGIDEPKIPFSRSGAGDAWAYSLIETGFDVFMRELPNTNKADTNYGTSVLEYNWEDSRTGHIVDNNVTVTVTPVQPLNLRVYTFKEVAQNKDNVRSQLIWYIGEKGLGWLGGLINFGFRYSQLIRILLTAITLIATILGILGIIAGILGSICCIPWLYAACGKCWCGVGWIVVAVFVVAGIAALWIASELRKHKVDNLKCLVRQMDDSNPSISTAIARSQGRIDYGIYQMCWPTNTSSATGILVDGRIFPPEPKYDVELGG